ncbi:MAG TPA: hypothetical protein VN025_16875 [Candidatus Dormibacteraeota bacterium]|nr:hypothetical protein [Candidatus Dormibacteraeota bacterium]
MKSQVRAGAILLTGLLSGSGYGLTLTLPQQQQQQNQQNNSGQQQGQQGQQGQPGQQNPNQQQGNQPNNGDKPTPLFGGSIGLKTSRQTKDSATLGFNGVDPNGQVQKSFLTAAVTPVDTVSAQKVAQTTVAPADLVQFLQDGGLNPDAAPQKP